MHIKKHFVLWLILALVAVSLPRNLKAVTTDMSSQVTYDHFEDGKLENIAIPAEGGLRLAPALDKVAKLDAAVIWCAVADKDGNIYVGTGNNGKVFKVAPDGKVETIFEPQEVLTHALALDDKGNLYIGTSPDGRVYRLVPGGRPEIFFDPPESYIWDMKFDAQGNLYVATGAKGRVYRLPPDYKPGQPAEIYFETDRTHVLRLAFDHEGKLLAGTGPKSLIYRITEKGKAVVLASPGGDEITALQAGSDGSVYYATFNKPSGAGSSGGGVRGGGGGSAAASGSAESSASRDDESAVGSSGGPNSTGASGSSSVNSSAGGQSQLMKINPDGSVEPVWSLGKIGLYAFRAMTDGRWLLGSDQHGRLFSASGPQDWELTQEVADSSEVSVLLPVPGDEASTYVLSSNPAQIYKLGAKPATSGTYQAEPFDLEQSVRWGTLRALAIPPLAGSVLAGDKWETRTGNTPKPDGTWSPWQAVGNDGAISSPSGRYFQYRVTLTDPAVGVRRLSVSSQQFNAAPVVDRVGVVPVGIEIVNSPALRPTIDLRQLTDGNGSSLLAPTQPRPQIRTTGEAGAFAVGWRASDPNGDQLVYSVQLRAVGEDKWVTLADDLDEPVFSFSSRGFKDGYYQVRIIANDKLSNPPGEERTGDRISTPFLIDNTPPEISLESQSGDAATYTLTFHAKDGISVLDSADYTLDGQPAKPALPDGAMFDKQEMIFHVRLERLKSGSHSVVFEVTDEAGNTGAAKASFETP